MGRSDFAQIARFRPSARGARTIDDTLGGAADLRVLGEVAELSAKVIVMADKGQELLRSVYGMPCGVHGG